MPRYLAGPGYRGNPGDTRKEGDPIPEAEHWTDTGVWIRAGHIVEVADAPAEPTGDPPEPPPPEPVDDPAEPDEPGEPQEDDGDNSDTYTHARLNFLRKSRLQEIAIGMEAPVDDDMGKKELIAAILAKQNQDS
jgi:hypothetical protein